MTKWTRAFLRPHADNPPPPPADRSVLEDAAAYREPVPPPLVNGHGSDAGRTSLRIRFGFIGIPLFNDGVKPIND